MRPIARIGSIAMAVGGWMYLAIAVIICFDIVARRLLGLSSGATTELSGYLMAIGMAWGLGGALLERAHVRIDVLVQKLPLGLRCWLHVASLAILTIVAGFFTYGAVSLAQDSLLLGATDLSSLQIPLVVPQGLWAAGIALLLVVCVALLARSLAQLAKGDRPAVEQALLARGYVEEAEETLEALGAPAASKTPQS